MVLTKVKEIVELLGLLSNWKESHTEFLNKFFEKETVIALLIYSIPLLDLQVHKGNGNQLNLFRCDYIPVNKEWLICLDLLGNYLNGEISSL